MTPYKMAACINKTSHESAISDEYLYYGAAGDNVEYEMDHRHSRYPFSIVWTPIPILTWLFPFVGHMGIGLSTGVIRDFAGPYIVTEDDMAFGKPTKYLQLDPNKAVNGRLGWDRAIIEASDIYNTRMHNLITDNCHSHVAMALNLMHYDGKSSWNMIALALKMFIRGKYVSTWAFIKSWFPFLISVGIVIVLVLLFKFNE